jgi:HAD superfamily hydrolase (TIGR01509 family)
MNWRMPAGHRGLIFDCDGTLVDSMPLHYHAWETVLARHDVEFPEARFYEWAGLPTIEIIRRLAADQGVNVDAAAVGAERDSYFHSLPESDLHPVEAVVEIARHYRGQYPMAVATGSTVASATASLQAIGVLDWFDAIISSQDVGPPKPAPDVFLVAAERIRVAPDLCVAFEDGEAGMDAARAAAMEVVDVRPWYSRTA